VSNKNDNSGEGTRGQGGIERTRIKATRQMASKSASRHTLLDIHRGEPDRKRLTACWSLSRNKTAGIQIYSTTIMVESRGDGRHGVEASCLDSRVRQKAEIETRRRGQDEIISSPQTGSFSGYERYAVH
jgi:hypothetical protein